MAGNLFGLKFEYKFARVSDTEIFHIVPLENIDQSVDNSLLKYRNEETKQFTIRAQFDKVEYEEKLNENYEKYSPIISRQTFKDTIIDTLRSKNSENELIDFLGFEVMEFMQYIIKNREFIVALYSDFISLQKKSNVVIDKLVTT